eukprot:scaffold164979_cov21-Tisochrysis_lutea.AAC.1
MCSPHVSITVLVLPDLAVSITLLREPASTTPPQVVLCRHGVNGFVSAVFCPHLCRALPATLSPTFQKLQWEPTSTFQAFEVRIVLPWHQLCASCPHLCRPLPSVGKRLLEEQRSAIQAFKAPAICGHPGCAHQP